MNKKRIVIGTGYPEFSSTREFSSIEDSVSLLNQTRGLVWRLHHPRLRKKDRYRLVLERVTGKEILPGEKGYKKEASHD